MESVASSTPSQIGSSALVGRGFGGVGDGSCDVSAGVVGGDFAASLGACDFAASLGAELDFAASVCVERDFTPVSLAVACDFEASARVACDFAPVSFFESVCVACGFAPVSFAAACDFADASVVGRELAASLGVACDFAASVCVTWLAGVGWAVELAVEPTCSSIGFVGVAFAGGGSERGGASWTSGAGDSGAAPRI